MVVRAISSMPGMALIMRDEIDETFAREGLAAGETHVA